MFAEGYKGVIKDRWEEDEMRLEKSKQLPLFFKAVIQNNNYLTCYSPKILNLLIHTL